MYVRSDQDDRKIPGSVAGSHKNLDLIWDHRIEAGERLLKS